MYVERWKPLAPNISGFTSCVMTYRQQLNGIGQSFMFIGHIVTVCRSDDAGIVSKSLHCQRSSSPYLTHRLDDSRVFSHISKTEQFGIPYSEC